MGLLILGIIVNDSILDLVGIMNKFEFLILKLFDFLIKLLGL
jgi:hypothetical protein